MLSQLRRVGIAVARRITTGWNRQWFERDGDASLAVSRIAVSISVLWTYQKYGRDDYVAYLHTVGMESYNAIGILALFGSQPLSGAFYDTCRIMAIGSTVLAMVGLFSRCSMFVSFVTNLVLASFFESFYGGAYWSHGSNLPLLAQLPLLFAPRSTTLSVDSYFSLAPLTHRPTSAWPVVLAQAGVSLVFFNAVYWKLSTDHFHFGWVFSDNLRNQLLVQYPWTGREIPGYLVWIVNHEWAWKSAALANVICQTAGIGACFFIHRPVWRAIFGAAYAMEVIGLGLVMNIWCPNWLPLTAVFIDWDALWRYVSKRRSGDAKNTLVVQGTEFLPQPGMPRFVATLLIVTFLTFHISVGFVWAPGKHFQRNVYPFSQFCMYSTIRAEKPFSRHHDYYLLGATFQLEQWDGDTDPCIVEKSLQRHFYYIYGYTDVKALSGSLGSLRSFLREEYAARNFQLKTYRTIFKAPAYPAPAGLEVVSRGLLATTDSTGRDSIVTANAKLDLETNRHYLEVQHQGFQRPALTFGYILNHSVGERPLVGELIGSRYYYEPPETGRYQFVVHVADRADEPKMAFYGDFPFH